MILAKLQLSVILYVLTWLIFVGPVTFVLNFVSNPDLWAPTYVLNIAAIVYASQNIAL